MHEKATVGAVAGEQSSAVIVSTTEAEQFLRLLGKNPSTTWFRTFPPGKGANRARGGRDLHGFDATTLEADNKAGESIYFITGDADQATGKNKKTGKPTGCVEDKDVHTCRALFCEWDDRPIDWQMQAWRELGLPEPSAMVPTGGKSVHCYWVLSEPMAPESWRVLQKRLIDYAGGDAQCKNPSRLMRLPGFRYVDKGTGNVTDRRTELIHLSGATYNVAEIEACLPAPQQPAPPAPLAALPNRQWQPRHLDEINAAAAYIPRRIVEGDTYHQSRNALCGCSAALAEAGQPDPDGAALALLGHLWPDEKTARQVLESTTTRNAASFWAIARDHGFDLRRSTKSSSTKQQQPAARKENKPRKLGHTRAMVCFDRCVQVLAKRERNSLRRRARLLTIAMALHLSHCVNRQDIAQRVLEAKDEHQGNSYTALTAADRLAMEWPEVDWLVPDLLPANDLSIIGGRPKVGKTAFAMAIAAAVLKGQPVAGCEAPSLQRPVILVSDDQGDADTVRAMRQLAIDDHQALLWSRRFRLAEQDLDKLLGDVAKHPGAVVIIDSLRSVARALPYGENDPEIGAVIYDLKAAVMDAGGSLLLIHHCNKGAGLTGVEALSGHNAIAGAANTVLTLHYVEDEKGKPCKEAEQRRLVREGRTGKPLDWAISRTAGTPSFHKIGTYAEWQAQVEETSKQAKRDARQTHTQGEVMEALAAARGRWLTCREVVEAMGLEWGDRGNGKDPSRVRDALNRLADEGEIKRERAGNQYTFATASYGTQNVSDTPTTSAVLQGNESERREQPRQTSAPALCLLSADTRRDSPRHRDRLQGNAADPVEVSEAQGMPIEAMNSRTGQWERGWHRIAGGKGSGSVLCSNPQGQTMLRGKNEIREVAAYWHRNAEQ